MGTDDENINYPSFYTYELNIDIINLEVSRIDMISNFKMSRWTCEICCANVFC